MQSCAHGRYRYVRELGILRQAGTASVRAKCSGCMHGVSSSLSSLPSARCHCSELLLPSSQELRKKQVKFWDDSLPLEEGWGLNSREVK